jgi:hypothetical protein
MKQRLAQRKVINIFKDIGQTKYIFQKWKV